MNSTAIYCLHGFLGTPADWAGVFDDSLKSAIASELQVVPTDLFDARFGTRPDMPEWAARFNQVASNSQVSRRLLLGYSLGGRLALHALLDQPSYWDAAVIVSANPGLQQQSARIERRRTDETWAQRFETEQWTALMDAWNALDVFGGRAVQLPREEGQYSRTNLAHALRAWSLGAQDNLLPRLAALPMPVLWVVGAMDRKFVRFAHEVGSAASNIQVRAIENAGHRVPWEQTNDFKAALRSFFNELR